MYEYPPVEILTAVPGLVWPAIAPPRESPMFTLAAQLAHSEGATPKARSAQQRRQLKTLLEHAAASVPYYHGRLNKVLRKDGSVDLDRWRRLPILKRRQVQTSFRPLNSRALPRSHGGSVEARTSGSTGTPLRVNTTALQQMIFGAMHLRKYRWHSVAFEWTVSNVRPLAAPKDGHSKQRSDENWRPGVRTGASHTLDIRAPFELQADWLQEHQPQILNTLPSNLSGLIDFVKEDGRDLSFIKQCHTLGEVVSKNLRERCLNVLGAPIVDAYSLTELGLISVQAPGASRQHIMSESHLVEVIKANGDPCEAGEIGRVIVTPLYGFAMPLIRYQTGDFAEVGEPSSDSITLPVLERIIGRYRNLAQRPDGSHYWPALDAISHYNIILIEQSQLRQLSPTSMSFWVVTPEPISSSDEAKLKDAIERCLGVRYDIDIQRVSSIEKGPGGKQEDFVCMIDA